MSDPFIQSPFLREVRSVFDGLLRRGVLTIGTSVFDEEAFGNAAVVLTGQTFQVRLVRDRGEVYVEARPSISDEWWPLQRVLRATGVAGAPAEGLLSVAQAANLIEEQISTLESGFGPGSVVETMSALRRLDADAAKQVEERWRFPSQR